MIQQGRVIVERDYIGLLIMLPDGRVEWAPNKRKATKLIKNFFKVALEDSSKIGVGSIEWRI